MQADTFQESEFPVAQKYLLLFTNKGVLVFEAF